MPGRPLQAKKMKTGKSSPILISTVILIFLSPHLAERQTLPISTINGGRASAPAPAQKTDALVFADQRLATVYPVIQKFKTLITSDPFNITATWTGSDLCSYKGFYCESPPDNLSALAVASIDFNGFQLSAPTLAGFLDELPDLALFHANSNYFSGTLPRSIAKLRYLYELDISNNKFSGQFPFAILDMDFLSFLDIRFNSFYGSIPPEIFTKSNLDVLFLNDNDFMTTLPDNIGTSHTVYLTLANNRFFGPIPASFSMALSRNLTEVLLGNNLLSGCLPYQLGLLKQAVVFDAARNRLTGPLPFSLGLLDNLEILNFSRNLLHGHIPEVVCKLGNLVNLSLSDNYFTSLGQACWRLIKNGALDLRRNCVAGLPFQRPWIECLEFFAFPRHGC